MFKVDNRSIRHCSGFFDVNFEYIWLVSGAFFAVFEHVHAGWNTMLP